MRKKNRGSYYTSSALADIMVKHSLTHFWRKGDVSILEPSCGDGVFIESVNTLLKPNRNRKHSMDAVELNKPASKKAKKRPRDKVKRLNVIQGDFFSFLKGKPRKKYDLIIGNPPYVVKKRLTKSAVKDCEEVYKYAGLSKKLFHNLWAAFLAASIERLTGRGMLAFILPAEFLQVKFAKEIREVLSSKFSRIEVVTFKEIVFNEIGQDTIVLFCYKKHREQGLFFSHSKNILELSKKPLSFKEGAHLACATFKWTGHILNQKEVELLTKLKAKFSPVSEYCQAAAGIVTAANDFFIVSEETLEEYDLQSFAMPIIQKGAFVNGSVTFSKSCHSRIKDEGKPCYLLYFNDVPRSKFPKKAKEYLKLGEENKLPARYKCLNRDPWYSIPGVWKTEGFFFKRSHLYPKILSNKAGVMVTDSAYRIKMKKGYDMDSLVYSFYNSLTLSLSELEGRSYGEGVLELTPNEFKNLALPYVKIDKGKFKKFAHQFENKKNIDDILQVVDRYVLSQHYGLNSKDIETLATIQKKLKRRRLGRSYE